MIEAYAFLAVFTVQILVMSVLHPAWFIKYFRAKAARFPPSASHRCIRVSIQSCSRALSDSVPRDEHGHRGARRVAAGLAVQLHAATGLGRRDGEGLGHCVFSGGADVAALSVIWLGVRYNKEHKLSLPEGKRTAVLQRRGLFDFVSPFTVFLAVLFYFLFAAFTLYVEQNPYLDMRATLSSGIGGVTRVLRIDALSACTRPCISQESQSIRDTRRSHAHDRDGQ